MNEWGIEVGDILEAGFSFRSRNNVAIEKGDKFKVRLLTGFNENYLITVTPLSTKYNETSVIVHADSLQKVKAENSK